MYVRTCMWQSECRRLYVRVAYSRGHTLVAFVYICSHRRTRKKERESWTELCRLCSCMLVGCCFCSRYWSCLPNVAERMCDAAWASPAPAAGGLTWGCCSRARSLCCSAEQRRGNAVLAYSFTSFARRITRPLQKRARDLEVERTLCRFTSDVDGPARKVELKIVPQKSIPELPKKTHL